VTKLPLPGLCKVIAQDPPFLHDLSTSGTRVTPVAVACVCLFPHTKAQFAHDMYSISSACAGGELF
jgi:hypothetical protein